ncbi:nitroreductase/quinone reductase family protein [Nocardia sp. PE-7]|uniref:nitroreductase/quinone reductase family protein n=1 Tax=Nocardia sp. PE-7 TaxID=3058426 RepID=UPI00265B1486|nr:nitroreductase/quinone reductase family protein [Nocardia sp. PE-7]WKG12542.1 nitroreductase/quinone reductase family protein [Nocardia sp. PE-7]
MDEARNEARRTAAEAEIGKHGRLVRGPRDGKLLSAGMAPFFRLRTPRGYGILTTTGRKTGLPRPKCVRVFRDGDRAYLVQLMPPHVTVRQPDAVNAWLRNVRADPRVTLKLLDGTHNGTAREIIDPDELATARALLCDTVVLVDFGECALHLRGMPSRAKIRELHEYWFDTGRAVAIDLTT